jgi:hypothetical protein
VGGSLTIEELICTCWFYDRLAIRSIATSKENFSGMPPPAESSRERVLVQDEKQENVFY